MIIESSNQIFKDYPISTSTISNEINMFEENIKIKVYKKEGYYLLEWLESNNKCLSKIIKYDIESLPLNQDTFHWFLESQY